ncbi:hypothetical protein CEP54_014691 [Fusarium duplospermum]|uniref:Uncharacterized protein n=1 Tax=Fusarium duplospermum TaxID=1325734 RepID=A0A428NUG7_9HYPO|nr:hypothetical protein CEP54_014691 [Fusarium duplospermum]
MPTTRASAANHSGAPLRATSLTKATKSIGVSRALRARQALRFIRSEHLQKTDKAYNVIQEADPGFYSLQALAESEVGNDNEEDWPPSWVDTKGTFQGWTNISLKKWLTVDLPAHLAQKAKELQSADKEAKKTGSKATDELPGDTSTKASERPSTTSREQELAKTNEQSPEEVHASQGIRSQHPPINIETSDKSAGAASETTTMARTPNTGTSSLKIQSSIEQKYVEKGSGGSIQVDKKKHVPDLVDVSVPDPSTGHHPPRAPGPHSPAAVPTPLEPSIRNDMPRFGQESTPGSQSTWLPVRFNTNLSSSDFPDLNTERDSSADSPHAEQMPTPSRDSHVPSSVQGSFSIPRGPLEPTSPPTIRVPVYTNETTNSVTEKPSSGKQLTYPSTFHGDKELKAWGTRTARDGIVSGFGIWPSTTSLNETSAGPSKRGMAVDMDELGSAAHQGDNAYNVIGELTTINLQRHETSSLQNGTQVEEGEGEGMAEEDPPAEWYEWYKKHHAEERKKREEANGQ